MHFLPETPVHDDVTFSSGVTFLERKFEVLNIKSFGIFFVNLRYYILKLVPKKNYFFPKNIGKTKVDCLLRFICGHRFQNSLINICQKTKTKLFDTSLVFFWTFTTMFRKLISSWTTFSIGLTQILPFLHLFPCKWNHFFGFSATECENPFVTLRFSSNFFISGQSRLKKKQ